MDTVVPHLPPWSKKRRVVTASAIVAYIVLASSFIGLGGYQVGRQLGWIRRPLTQESVLLALTQDAGFFRAVTHSVKQRECVNPTEYFRLAYAAPLHPVQINADNELCHKFISTHPTGQTIEVQLEVKKESRMELVNQMSKSFSTIQTEMMSGTVYETSRLTGVIEGEWTQIYVIGVGDQLSWVISYAPMSPMVDNEVLDLVLSFRLDRR